FWKTVSKVVIANETINFKVDRQEIVYTVDMFRSTLKLPVETLKNPFIAPTTMKFIQPFLKIIRYQGDVDKVSAFFIKNLAQPWQTMFKVFNRCLTSRTSGDDPTKINIIQIFHVVVNRIMLTMLVFYCGTFFTAYNRRKMLSKDYHSIKDDIPLVSVYTTGNMTVRGMLISDAFITDDVRAIEEYNKTPSAHRTPTPTAIVGDVVQKKQKRKQVAGETSSPKSSLKIRVKQIKPSTTLIPRQEKLMEKDIEKMVDDAEAESCASEFADSFFQDDDDDSGNRIEPESHKEHPKTIVDDDDENAEEKKDDKKDDEDNDNDDTLIIYWIVKVVRVTTEQQHGLDFMEQIIVIRKMINYIAFLRLTSNKPDTGLIYLNSKEEKRVTYLIEIVKFCDAMLERALKEVKLKIFKIEFLEETITV
nr:hypothetical protein [Tanacetum cinerariifolium]